MKNHSINIFRIVGEPVLESEKHAEVGMVSLYLFDSSEGHRGNGVAISAPIALAGKVQRAAAAFMREMRDSGGNSEG
jgi:hypothetical protein